mmetsp:Transcript_14628/g.23816  ORF Transcript_14628/g.23816 Transcript_14628/m.23816 type:complete len:228 (+) Transcript_14628:64-747(+)|eukprot:CAMPEP_0203792936 /NCGR_PEP_ID=MMETSP0100_2-20121128/5555_1 /ASSEMBLY_ACC=CAM_ASM_000210 /TAXON_ID=96639 /ORGANISM=" , Strain NY0313808BC1" /LENGTH=227 /DNA_ID=CAMNT_0050696597 /DNA_START=488 /DNA_END=1171 /DNA_ORIENTATION=+
MKVSSESVAAVLFAVSSPVVASRPFLCYLENPDLSCNDYDLSEVIRNKTVCAHLPSGENSCYETYADFSFANESWAALHYQLECPDEHVSISYSAAPPCGSNKKIPQLEKEQQLCALEDTSVGCPKDSNSAIVWDYSGTSVQTICHNCVTHDVEIGEDGKYFCIDGGPSFDVFSANATCKFDTTAAPTTATPTTVPPTSSATSKNEMNVVASLALALAVTCNLSSKN